jgi:transcriptional regulator with XRE-family HTH domain
VQSDIATKIRQTRLSQNFSRATLSERSGVAPESLKRFENTGEVSLKSLVRLCFALGLVGDLQTFAAFSQPLTLAELDRQEKAREGTRKRGRR